MGGGEERGEFGVFWGMDGVGFGGMRGVFRGGLVAG